MDLKNILLVQDINGHGILRLVSYVAKAQFCFVLNHSISFENMKSILTVSEVEESIN